MAMNYAELAMVANQLIADTGRIITVSRFQQSPADANKPWEGPSSAAAPDATDDVTATFVGYSDSGFKCKDVDLAKRTEEVCFIGPEASFDVTTANDILDGSVHKRVLWADRVKPGSTVLLYVLGIGR